MVPALERNSKSDPVAVADPPDAQSLTTKEASDILTDFKS
jgi:hypothetical protein